jgi:hypothetical protein
MVGGGAAAVFAAIRLGEVLIRNELSPAATLAWLLQHVRMSVLHPDLNAAGSYFSLFVVAAIVVWFRQRLGWLVLTLPLLLLAFGLARSRAAIGSVVLVLTAWTSSIMLRSMRMRVALGVAVLGACMLGGTLLFTSQSNVGFDQALAVRVQMTEVGIRTALRDPWFGVGLGDYIRMSRRWITPEMTLLRGFAPQGENAHNNFLQILVELGLPACLFFIYLTGSVARLGWTMDRGELSPEATGLALGLSAFLLSAFFGHPLLIPQVAAAFFLALGLTAGLGPAPRVRTRAVTSIFRGTAAFYLLSLLWRLA